MDFWPWTCSFRPLPGSGHEFRPGKEHGVRHKEDHEARYEESCSIGCGMTVKSDRSGPGVCGVCGTPCQARKITQGRI